MQPQAISQQRAAQFDTTQSCRQLLPPMATLAPRPLLRGEITFSEAKTEDVDILKQLTYVDAQSKFFNLLSGRRDDIKNIVARHLRLSNAETCSIPCVDEWLHGSFNVGLPVTINRRRDRPGQRVLIRFPLPYKVGESFRPGNADEKLRCEVATYAWVDEHCASVPTPHLWGFALSDGQTFTALEHLSLITRCLHNIQRGIKHMLGYPVPSRYIPMHDLHELGIGYLLTDFIENGRLPLPRIGSFTIDNNGFLSLANRPLTLELHQLENEGIPIDIPRNFTYSTTEQYVMDLLYCHRTRLAYQPNAIHSKIDGLEQISAMTVMETVFSHFFNRSLRHGPFALTLTDVHLSNIFVDDEWHVTSMVDLEWACTRPLDMQHPPYWLTSQSVDAIDADAYDQMRQEYMKIFDTEETKLRPIGSANDSFRWTENMRRGWESGNFWYCLALDNPTGVNGLLYNHIQPIFSRTHAEEAAFYKTMFRYWMPESWTFMNAKMEEQQRYDERLRKFFEVPGTQSAH
ncbi:MAG: hypothetical protein M1837_003118 [Sclerophora amabilis]|nr:MAG: hypothetical protein M1837_003118 [Sclerophora amabilis]